MLEEGDIICSSDDSGGLINVATRIEDLRIKPNHQVAINQARRYSTLMFSDEVASHRIPVASTLRYVQTKNSVAEFIDNFPIKDAFGLTGGFVIAVTHDQSIDGDWRGWTLYADYGDGYSPIAQGDVPALLGTATTTLSSVSDPSVFDRVNSLSFTLKYDDPTPLSSASESDLLSNPYRNLFLYGNEYLQAANIVNLGGGSYTASTFLRGRFNTDGAQLTHSASERVVMLNGAEQFVPIPISRLNGAFNYKVVTTNQDLADATPVSFTWTGGNLRPPAPVNLRGSRDADGNLLIEWTRRSRLGSGMISGSDVPLAEEDELYDVEILDGSNTVVRTISINAKTGNPALLKGTVNPQYVSFNSLLSPTISDTAADAYTIQRLDRSGSWIEARLSTKGSDVATLGLIEPQYAPRYGFELPATMYQTSVTFSPVALFPGSPGLRVLERAPADAVASVKYESGLLGSVDAVRLRIMIVGSEARYYWDYTGEGSVPFYVSTIPAPLPLVGTLHVGNSLAQISKIEDVFIGSLTTPSTLYTAEMQSSSTDFGSIQSAIKVRVYQRSAIVGRGPYVEAIL